VQHVYGKDLRIGDTIEVWWTPGRDTITGLRPYTGNLAHLFREGAQLAEFAICKTGMTIDNASPFVVVTRVDSPSREHNDRDLSDWEPLDSNSRYAFLTPYERKKQALEDVLEIVSKHDELDEQQTTALQDILNQGLCTGRKSGCGCDWCESYDPDPCGGCGKDLGNVHITCPGCGHDNSRP
jgi:hypothetical protein